MGSLGARAVVNGKNSKNHAQDLFGVFESRTWWYGVSFLGVEVLDSRLKHGTPFSRIGCTVLSKLREQLFYRVFIELSCLQKVWKEHYGFYSPVADFVYLSGSDFRV